MSLLAMPFVDTPADTVLFVISGVVLIGTLGALIWGFWKIHEIPLNKAHQVKHSQIGLVTALTWIGFFMHWVWVLAVIVAFTDLNIIVRKIRQAWDRQSRALDREDY